MTDGDKSGFGQDAEAGENKVATGGDTRITEALDVEILAVMEEDSGREDFTGGDTR
ncbi:MAG: hypothetical protein JWO81_3210 [Alphaproteobacteria bacterium]|nr:hypothetical protein [Alphaproteobacteria bacterium]